MLKYWAHKRKEDAMKIGYKLNDDSRKNLVEITQGRKPEPHVQGSHFSDHARIALEYINNNPGSGCSEISTAAGYATDGGCYGWLQRSVQRGDIKSRKLDGKTRYYAKNYMFAGEIKKPQVASAIGNALRTETEAVTPTASVEAPVLPLAQGVMVQKSNIDLLALAKDYSWDKELTGIEKTALKNFMDWVNSR